MGGYNGTDGNRFISIFSNVIKDKKCTKQKEGNTYLHQIPNAYPDMPVMQTGMQ